MAGVGVADVEGDGHDALLGFAQQSSRSIHVQIDMVARGGDAHGAFEEAIEVEFAEADMDGQLIEAELLGDVLGQPLQFNGQAAPIRNPD